MAIVVSAFHCCGKSYINEHQDEYGIKVLDVEKAHFEFMEVYPTDEEVNAYIEEKKTKPTLMPDEYFIKKFRETPKSVKNPEFPDNYINYINKNMEFYDVIFVDSDIKVREALTQHDIKFITVYPRENALDSWVGRMYRRGDNDSKIDRCISNWESEVNSIIDEPHGSFIVRLGSDDYLYTILPDLLQWFKNPTSNMRYMLFNRLEK